MYPFSGDPTAYIQVYRFNNNSNKIILTDMKRYSVKVPMTKLTKEPVRN